MRKSITHKIASSIKIRRPFLLRFSENKFYPRRHSNLFSLITGDREGNNELNATFNCCISSLPSARALYDWYNRRSMVIYQCLHHQNDDWGKLVPSSKKRRKFRHIIIRQFRKGNQSIWEGIPIPDLLIVSYFYRCLYQVGNTCY